MTDLTVIVPSRGRPERARVLVEMFHQTCTAKAFPVFAVDDNDPTVEEYRALAASTSTDAVGVVVGPGRNMVEALNATAVYLTSDLSSFAVGFMGDDHCPRSYSWDAEYLKALREMGTGIVYGNDLLQGSKLPTQVAMTSDIIRALGYMAPPSLVHLAVDNWWLELGRGAGCIRYLPDVIVEHRHPVAGKAPWDEGYLRVNSQQMYERDLTEFARLRETELPGAVEKVLALRSARV